ncbi:hypothetical protein GCM10015536_56900 [Streptomyces griseomycini]|nr:hypothetical protein GCM10015536_56900 [Streptomyces griseomycini]
MRDDDPAVGEQLAGVLEEQDAVAHQPCSGWDAMVCAASRSGLSADGHVGVCVHSETGSRVAPMAVVAVSSRVLLRMGSPGGKRARDSPGPEACERPGHPCGGRPA